MCCTEEAQARVVVAVGADWEGVVPLPSVACVSAKVMRSTSLAWPPHDVILIERQTGTTAFLGFGLDLKRCGLFFFKYEAASITDG